MVGDIYGAPNDGELAPVTFKPDLSFVLDLNKSRENLAKALVPTEFSQKWMAIEPAEARVARLSPFVLPADGIAPVGMTEWLDDDSGDQADARSTSIVRRGFAARSFYEGRSLRFDIEAKEAGYLWIQQPEGSGDYQEAPWPGRVVLAVVPIKGSGPISCKRGLHRIFRRADPSIYKRARTMQRHIFVAITSIAASTMFLAACAKKESPTAAARRRGGQAGRPRRASTRPSS